VECKPLDWICENCHKDVERLHVSSECPPDKTEKDFIYTQVHKSIQAIKTNGIMTRRELVKTFQESLLSSGYEALKLNSPGQIQKSFENMLAAELRKLDHIGKHHVDKYSSLIGTIYYDRNKVHAETHLVPDGSLVHDNVAKQIYEVMFKDAHHENQLQEWKNHGIKTTEISPMLQKQAELFNTADSKVDYSKKFGDDKEEKSYLFQDYLLASISQAT